jgi:two-component system cell cycle sensor histidine kinase/response regulator CckA
MTAVLEQRGIEILLVEDSPTDRLIAIEALQQSRLINAVNVVENGVEALAYLRREGKFKEASRPDLVLLDLNLPKKDGREVLIEIKHDPELSFIPVIVLTTSSADEDVARAYFDHANSYITKPVDFPRFTRALEVIGQYWFEVVTLPPVATLARLERRLPSLPVGSKQEQFALVVLSDDSAIFRDLSELLYESSAVRFEVSHLVSAMDLRQRLDGLPCDVLIVDLGIGESVGLEAYRRARMAAPDAAIIVLTGQDGAGELALREGADDFLNAEERSRPLLLRAIRYATSRRQLQNELRRARRMEAIGQIASGIAHDFNNLLTVLHGHAELLSDGASTAVIDDSVQGIRDASERATQLTRQLLAFSLKQTPHIKAIDLNQVVNDFSKLLRRVLGNTVRLELRLSPRAPSALADIGMVEQSLLNLAIDARDAMPDGGQLVIETGQVRLDGAALPHAQASAGDFATLTVRDTGTASAEREALTGPLMPPEARNGAGNALAIVRGIIEQQRGWVQLDSAPETGKAVRIFLPQVQTSRAEMAPADSTALPRGTENILLVDDESPVRQMAKAILGRHGYQVLEARSGSDAISTFEGSPRRVDLLLTDMVMPGGMTGRELAQELQRRDPKLKVVFTSGYGRELSAPGLVLNEGVDFLPKPYAVSRLLGAVRRALDGTPAPPAPAPPAPTTG